MPELTVGICGAGIGGLFAAIAMRKAGVQVTVLEAAAQLGEIGAGIQVCSPYNHERLTQEALDDTKCGSSADQVWRRHGDRR